MSSADFLVLRSSLPQASRPVHVFTIFNGPWPNSLAFCHDTWRPHPLGTSPLFARHPPELNGLLSTIALAMSNRNSAQLALRTGGPAHPVIFPSGVFRFYVWRQSPQLPRKKNTSKCKETGSICEQAFRSKGGLGLALPFCFPRLGGSGPTTSSRSHGHFGQEKNRSKCNLPRLAL